MGDKRFTDNPSDPNPDGLDIVAGTDTSTGADKKYSFNTIGSFVKNFIGVATAIKDGLMPMADKTKLDFYPAGNPGADKQLISDGGGALVFAPFTAGGDMLKSVYDTGDDGKADNANQADKINASPGNNYFYVTNGAGVQLFVLQSAIADMKRSAYAIASATKVDRSIDSDDTDAVGGNSSAVWTGQTVGAVTTELLPRLVLADDTAYLLVVEVSGLKDDLGNAASFIRQMIIKNLTGTVSLVGAVQTIGVDINPEALTDPVFTADVGNKSLQVDVTGKAAQTWNWKAKTILTKL